MLFCNIYFEAFAVITTLMMGTEIVPETLVSTCNQLTRLCAREDFIVFYNSCATGMNLKI
jgi:hypothetical protein